MTTTCQDHITYIVGDGVDSPPWEYFTGADRDDSPIGDWTTAGAEAEQDGGTCKTRRFWAWVPGIL